MRKIKSRLDMNVKLGATIYYPDFFCREVLLQIRANLKKSGTGSYQMIPQCHFPIRILNMFLDHS